MGHKPHNLLREEKRNENRIECSNERDLKQTKEDAEEVFLRKESKLEIKYAF